MKKKTTHTPISTESPHAEDLRATDRNSPGILSSILSGLFSLLLALFTVLLVVLLFLHALSQNVLLPAVGGLSSYLIVSFFDHWYFLILGVALVLIQLLAILLLNLSRVRRFYLSVGCAAVGAAVLCCASGFLAPRAIRLFSGAWQDILVNTTAVFRDFSAFCAIVLAAVGFACISIYSCIRAVKGGSHEKAS